MAAAIGINSGLTRFRSVFRVGYYMPVVTSIVAIAVVWRFLLQPDSGLINSLLRLIGIDGPNWLASTTWSLPTIIVMIAWRGLGFQMVIFLAGLQAIPQELYEAARVDGAGAWKQFRHVTLPSLRPTLLFTPRSSGRSACFRLRRAVRDDERSRSTPTGVLPHLQPVPGSVTTAMPRR
jgi:multiple sugar transport system permease protein